jgi:hypothetical protein
MCQAKVVVACEGEVLRAIRPFVPDLLHQINAVHLKLADKIATDFSGSVSPHRDRSNSGTQEVKSPPCKIFPIFFKPLLDSHNPAL